MENFIKFLQERIPRAPLGGEYNPLWASKVTGYRSHLRQSLEQGVKDVRGLKDVKNFKDINDEKSIKDISDVKDVKNIKNFKDLKALPYHPLLSISISHCPSLGMYAWEKKPTYLGIDVEITHRVSLRVAQRVSKNPLEWKRAPSPAFLWTAKEAAYKAYSSYPAYLNHSSNYFSNGSINNSSDLNKSNHVNNSNKKKVLSDFVIGDWTKREKKSKNFYSFSLLDSYEEPLKCFEGYCFESEKWTFAFVYLDDKHSI